MPRLLVVLSIVLCASPALAGRGRVAEPVAPAAPAAPVGPDSDGDGVPDADDVCANEAGLIGRRGCGQYMTTPSSAGSCYGELLISVRAGVGVGPAIVCADGPVLSTDSPRGLLAPPGLAAGTPGRLHWDDRHLWTQFETHSGAVLTPVATGGPAVPTAAGSCQGRSYVSTPALPVTLYCDDGRNLTIAPPAGLLVPREGLVLTEGDVVGLWSWDAAGTFIAVEQGGRRYGPAPMPPLPGTVTPAPAPVAPPVTPAPSGCVASGAPVTVGVLNNVSEPVSVYRTDGTCAPVLLGTLAHMEERSFPATVGATITTRKADGTEVQRFVPLARDAPSVRIPARAFQPSGYSCHGVVVEVRPVPTAPLSNDLVFRCDKTVANFPFTVGMMRWNPNVMPTPGTTGTLTFDGYLWERFEADSGAVYVPGSIGGE